MDVSSFDRDKPIALFWSIDKNAIILKIGVMQKHKPAHVCLRHAHIERKGCGDNSASDDRQTVAHKIGIRHRICHETVRI